MEKIFEKLNKTNLNKMFIDKSTINRFLLTVEDDESYDVFSVDCDFKNRKKLIDLLFSEMVLEIVEKYNHLIMYNLKNDSMLYIIKEDYLKFYKSKYKQESLYETQIKIEDNQINCCIGIRDNNDDISNIKECKGNKKVIIEFINKYLQLYSILSFHEKNKVVIKLNDYDWLTSEELINDGLAIRRIK